MSKCGQLVLPNALGIRWVSIEGRHHARHGTVRWGNPIQIYKTVNPAHGCSSRGDRGRHSESRSVSGGDWLEDSIGSFPFSPTDSVDHEAVLVLSSFEASVPSWVPCCTSSANPP